MEIHENHDAWKTAFEAGWLAHFHQTGSPDWKAYPRPRNLSRIPGAGVELASSRLMLISSAGGYLRETQTPFDAANPFGDYTLRLFEPETPLDQVAFAHEHYNHAAVNADPQVLLPLEHLRAMVAEGKIGALTSVVSIMGFQPDISRVLTETIPAVVQAAREVQARAALLVPA